MHHKFAPIWSNEYNQALTKSLVHSGAHWRLAGAEDALQSTLDGDGGLGEHRSAGAFLGRNYPRAG